MNRSLSSLLFTVMFTACTAPPGTLSLKWEVVQRLPGEGGRAQL